MGQKRQNKAKQLPNGDFEMVTDDEDTDEMYFSPTDGEDSETGQKKPQRIIMYCKHTHYDVIKEAGKNFLEFHLTKKEKSDWDIAWFDGPISIKLLKDMNYNQRTNHFPGIYNLAKKNMLGRHLMKMQKLLPGDYNFFPTTYMLPHDYKDFREDSFSYNGKGYQYYIVKPEDSCQGKGIFLTRNWEAIKPLENMVIQKYLKKPHLIDGYKYDLRLYFFINGINPLRVYLYRDGLARFATSKYKPPSDRNEGNLFMHLTNYAINKESENYVEASGVDYESTGSKRSYQSILDNIEADHGVIESLRVQQNINDIILKSICMVQPHVWHLVRSSQPEDIENQLCFQILGFDVMLDSKLKPWLIEINQMPSFGTDSTLDYKIKRGLIVDCLKTLNLSMPRKNRYKIEKKNKFNERMMQKPVHTIKPMVKRKNGKL